VLRDNYGGDTNLDYQSEMDQAAADGMSWLWWSWNSGKRTVECPVSGATCQAYVTGSQNGFCGREAIDELRVEAESHRRHQHRAVCRVERHRSWGKNNSVLGDWPKSPSVGYLSHVGSRD